MQQEFYQKLEKALSGTRLSVYSQDDPGSCVTMARYLWNIALCESLYSPLQMCEIALRNAIHETMSALHGRATWYDVANLTSWGYSQIGEAKSKITRANHQLTSDRIVAEMHFGFWTSLFEDHYERNEKFLPRGIKSVFPNLPKSQHNRKKIKQRLEKIRQLRNRVFHHERIIHWKDLSRQHEDILETVGWICEGLKEMSLTLDRFIESYSEGITPWLTKLNRHWPVE